MSILAREYLSTPKEKESIFGTFAFPNERDCFAERNGNEEGFVIV